MDNEPRGRIFQQGNILRIDNALIEDASCLNDNSGYILISYAEPQNNNTDSIRNIRLNLNRSTVILSTLGQRMCLCCLRPGMSVNVVFSSAMTRSIPPQANAYLVIAQRRLRPQSLVSDGRIAYVDTAGNFVYTGNPNNIDSQTRYAVTGSTVITSRSGRRIGIDDLRPGQSVRITHANFQTASIPPQTTAFRIQVI